MAYERIIDVFVVDRNGRRINGAKIAFEKDGIPAGEVPLSYGNARIQLPDRTSVIRVIATYDNTSQDATLANSQDSFTFKFDVNTAPGSFVEKHIALVVGLALFVVAVVLAFVFGTPTPLQQQILLGTFSLAGGAIATEISGMINVNLKLGTKLTVAATGALAIFVILYFFVPAAK